MHNHDSQCIYLSADEMQDSHKENCQNLAVMQDEEVKLIQAVQDFWQTKCGALVLVVTNSTDPI